MGRARKKSLFVIVDDTLWFIGEGRVLDFESEPEKPLAEELERHVADPILVSLRKSFTLTFPENPFIDGLTEALMEIRRVCVEALIDMPEALEDLGLPPIPPVDDDKRVGKPQVFRFAFAKATDLRIKVKYEKRMRSLFNLLEPDQGDELICTTRNIVTLTFSEMHSEEQHEKVLLEIRKSIWDVLPAYNEYLVAIEVEPIAAMVDEGDYDEVS